MKKYAVVKQTDGADVRQYLKPLTASNAPVEKESGDVDPIAAGSAQVSRIKVVLSTIEGLSIQEREDMETASIQKTIRPDIDRIHKAGNLRQLIY